MPEDSKARHLGAVMFTDVVGYTAMMQEDEAAARAVRERHRAVLEAEIVRFGGQLLQYLGDGSLSVFPSAVNAVSAAAEIQREARLDDRLPLRIGIHQGEISWDEQGAYGDSVNIAARIQSLGVPGSVLISEKVHDDVKNQPTFETVLLGTFELKNVSRPIEIYAVSMPGLEVPSSDDVEIARRGAQDDAARGRGLLGLARGLRASTLATGVAAVVLGVALGWSLTRGEPPVVARFDVTPGEGRAMLPNVVGVDLAISDDGLRIVYVGQAPGGTQLWQRTLGGLEPQLLPGTTDARDPVISPNGETVAYRAGGRLMTIPLGGGSPTTVVARGLTGGPAWGPDRTLYYPADGVLHRVDARGGEPQRVTEPTEGATHVYPQVLPGGRDVLFTIEVAGSPEESRIAVASVQGDEIEEILPGTMARYAPSGHLLHGAADGTVHAVPFDPRSRTVEGPSATILTEADLKGGSPTKFAVSANGSLLYRTGLVQQTLLQFAWVTRSGNATVVDPDWTVNPGQTNRAWDVSPDGTRIALKAETDLGEDIWVKVLPAGPMDRFTFGETEERMPRWSADGETLYYIVADDGHLNVWARPADGTGGPVKVGDMERSIADVHPGPNGEWLLFRTVGSPGVAGGRDVFGLRIGVDSVPVPLLTSEADEAAPAISPDGNWIVYHSDETGRREIFVRPFPNVDDGQYQISRGGARAAVWSSTGREIFYVADGGTSDLTRRQMTMATVDPGPPFRVLDTQTLFSVEDSYYLANNSTSYRLMGDDERFLMGRYMRGTWRVELVLVQNFAVELR
jgi:class 3 adenylate cyclase/Tol biopolymer transport system component